MGNSLGKNTNQTLQQVQRQQNVKNSAKTLAIRMQSDSSKIPAMSNFFSSGAVQNFKAKYTGTDTITKNYDYNKDGKIDDGEWLSAFVDLDFAEADAALRKEFGIGQEQTPDPGPFAGISESLNNAWNSLVSALAA